MKFKSTLERALVLISLYVGISIIVGIVLVTQHIAKFGAGFILTAIVGFIAWRLVDES
jgi:hypothetical protein